MLVKHSSVSTEERVFSSLDDLTIIVLDGEANVENLTEERGSAWFFLHLLINLAITFDIGIVAILLTLAAKGLGVVSPMMRDEDVEQHYI